MIFLSCVFRKSFSYKNISKFNSYTKPAFHQNHHVNLPQFFIYNVWNYFILPCIIRFSELAFYNSGHNILELYNASGLIRNK